MQQKNDHSASCKYRDAFERLKVGKGNIVIGPDVVISQANVAREAGNIDPTSFKKSRNKQLVAEIQDYVRLKKKITSDKTVKANRRSSKSKKKIEVLELRIDELMSKIERRDQFIERILNELDDCKSKKDNIE